MIMDTTLCFSTLDDFLKHLSLLDIRLRVEKGKLKYDAPKKVMTNDLINYLKLHKSELIRVIEKNSDEDLLPISSFQKWFWINQQKYPDAPLYNVPKLFRIKGELDIEYLKKTFEKIFIRHEILRTTFHQHGEEIVQYPPQKCLHK